MLWNTIFLSSSIFLIVAICWFNIIQIVLFGFVITIGIVLGLAIFLYIYVRPTPRQRIVLNASETGAKLTEFREILRKQCMTEEDDKKEAMRYPLIFTRLVDGVLQNLLDLSFRDFVGLWLKNVAIGADELIDLAKQDVWAAIQGIYDRAIKIDQTNLVACKIVDKVTFHLEKIRIAEATAAEGVDPLFLFSPHLLSLDGEIEYLRKVSEVFILFFLPQGYSQSPLKQFLREIITTKMLKPTIDTLTDPDYINQKILSYIEKQHLTEAMHRNAFEYAESFEDFLSLIKSTRDLENLKHIRYNIVSEIMQATTMQNIQKSQSSENEDTVDNEQNNIIQNKKIKRYISQLKYVKRICEQHMLSLGWNGYTIQDDDVIDAASTADNRILPLQTVLQNVSGRKFFSQFLEQTSNQDLISYWTAVQDLRSAEKSSWHQLGAEIFYTYIRSPSAEIKVDKEIMKRIESFLLGDASPDVLYEIQDMVVKTLEEKYYPSFLICENYKKMLETINIEKIDGIVEDLEVRKQINGNICENTSLLVGENSNYARGKLDQIEEKLSNKIQALQALSTSLKPESKVLGILAKEIEWLQGEKRRLEAHLKHTEMWAEHLGRWRAEVQSAETPENGEPPEYVIVVHMAENEADESSISTGWVVLRKLPDFQELHRKLRQLCSNVRNLELPSQPLKFFGKADKTSSERAKIQIQKYLSFVLEDDRLNQSEALYAFLSPSSEHLKHSPTSPKKSRFSLSTLFKSTSSSSSSSGESREKDDEEGYTLLDDNDSSKSVTDGYFGPSKDVIAEPLYALLEEIFNLRGVFRWLRRSLITFVQLSYGRTISRQIRDTVSWMFSETMLHYYIQQLIKSWWPNGQLVNEFQERSVEDKLKTKEESRKMFINSVPDVLTNLVGAQSAQRGYARAFDSLQNTQMNKQLFYDIFEVVMYEMFPELQNPN